jgi:hypothetical protein
MCSANGSYPETGFRENRTQLPRYAHIAQAIDRSAQFAIKALLANLFGFSDPPYFCGGSENLARK